MISFELFQICANDALNAVAMHVSPFPRLLYFVSSSKPRLIR